MPKRPTDAEVGRVHSPNHGIQVVGRYARLEVHWGGVEDKVGVAVPVEVRELPFNECSLGTAIGDLLLRSYASTVRKPLWVPVPPSAIPSPTVIAFYIG